MALRHLSLRNFVIVPALEMELQGGFSVLTGETGAGKSILIDALQLTLGGRGDAGVVRAGAERAEIAVTFDDVPTLHERLQEAGFEVQDSLLLRRVIDAQGKSRAWINGSAATVTQLRELAPFLLDIHGQHAWQSLTRAADVRELLDGYAGIDTAPLRQAWTAWREAAEQLHRARADADEAQNERERLDWQLQEMNKLAPQPQEWAQLQQDHTRLLHAQTLIEAATRAAEQLDNAESSGALNALNQAQHALDAERAHEPQFAEWIQALSDCAAQASDVLRSLHAYARHTELDPERLSELDARLGAWLSLARRYKRLPEDLPVLWQEWQTQRQALELAQDMARLEQLEASARSNYEALAQSVSARRRAAAEPLSEAVTARMGQLGMQGGRFEVQIEASAQPGSSGLDEVVFCVAGHAGTAPRPVAKVASGGELSRIALALAVSTSELGQADTLIFDEVDSGVGGVVAQTVGQLLRELGRHRQVLAITHLPQVAAWGHHHWVVSKTADTQGATSHMHAVVGAHRETELARMLGGSETHAPSLAHAQDLLQRAAASSVTESQ